MNSNCFRGMFMTTLALILFHVRAEICGKVDPDKFPGCVSEGFSSTIKALSEGYYAKKHSEIINSMNKTLERCSNYTNIVLCSLFVPQCRENQPWLPCRSVCEEFVHDCGDKIASSGMSWLISLCPELPEKEDCFKPQNFTPSSGSSGPTCNQDMLFNCSDVGDTKLKTFVTNITQEQMKNNRTKTLEELLRNETQSTCTDIIKLLVCAKYIPPCLKAEETTFRGMTLCQAKCYDIDNFCSSGTKNNSDIQAYCAAPAQGDTPSGLCELNGWPTVAKFWPRQGTPQALSYSFPPGLIAVLVLVPVLAIVAIYAAVAVRRNYERKKNGYVQQPKSYTEPEEDPAI